MENLNHYKVKFDVHISVEEYINYLTNNDTIKKFMINYAKYYRKYHPDRYRDDVTLPESLKILSKLKLKDKNINLITKELLPIIKFENKPIVEFTTIIKDDIDTQEYLINELIQFINIELETKNNLYITTLVDNISIIDNKMIISCLFHVE